MSKGNWTEREGEPRWHRGEVRIVEEYCISGGRERTRFALFIGKKRRAVDNYWENLLPLAKKSA